MTIWFDISNSPQVLMFQHLIQDLKNEGHQIVITSRPLANTVALLDQRKLEHHIIGEHYGKNFYKKLFGYPIRVIQLRNFLKKSKPDLAVSQSSFHSPVVAWLLGIPSIYTNDNEHALGNIPAFYLASQILIPETLKIEQITKSGISKKKVFQYPGVKEGIYLWPKINGTSFQKGVTKKMTTIYVRPEPLTAQYYKGKQNFLDTTIYELQNKYNITILVRDKTQLMHYKQAKFSKVNVPEKPLAFDDIRKTCILFVGAGGSMTRELAILGVPTISVYQDDLLEVDKYLISKGIMSHEPCLSADMVEKYLVIKTPRGVNEEIMKKGKKAYTLLKELILNHNKP